VLNRPAVLAVPGFALRLVLGEFGGEALGSQRVLPAVLAGAGYRFEHTDLESALHWSLSR
jgi:NAD dependent epimerase/dehydratase family enzyme